MGKITEEKNNVGDNNEERDTFNEDIKETSSRVRLRKPKKKVSFWIISIVFGSQNKSSTQWHSVVALS